MSKHLQAVENRADIKPPASSPSSTEGSSAAQAQSTVGRVEPAVSGPVQGAAALVAVPSSAPAPAVPVVSVDPAMGALVAGLRQLGGTNAALTPEAVAAWRTNFMQLVQGGAASVPALRSFLEQGGDVKFTREAWQMLGYGSARMAAIDALRQIGSPEAIGVLEGMLGTTKTPKEIATVAWSLEQASPGQYRQQALAAVRASLAAAGAASNPQLDVAPLFEVFSHYGDASVIPELEQAMNKWNYYATIALANLPENAGVPSILRLADPATGSGSRTIALEMAAQLAATNPDARQFFAAQVANKAISPNMWPYLIGPLSGDQYYPVDSAITTYPQVQSWSDLKTTHLGYGNQNLYTLPAEQSLTAEGIQQRLALVDELAKSTTDPAALKVLQQARDTLAKRSVRTAP